MQSKKTKILYIVSSVSFFVVERSETEKNETETLFKRLISLWPTVCVWLAEDRLDCSYRFDSGYNRQKVSENDAFNLLAGMLVSDHAIDFLFFQRYKKTLALLPN